MARRRLYVFGAIILLGVLVGVFCLPDGGEKEPTGSPEGSKVANTKVEPPGGIPPADLANTPAKQAERLVHEARAVTDRPRKAEMLLEAYRLDSDGLWGGEAAALLGDLFKDAGSVDKARQWYMVARGATVSGDTLTRLNNELRDTHADSGTPALAKIKMLTYRVQPGDSLWKIARRHATTINALRKANRLTSDLIRVDKILKVPQGPFHVHISRKRHTLRLLQGDKAVKLYRVGLGKDSSTPVGTFPVGSKLENPVWYSDRGRIPPGDPRNVLGSRWIGFEGRVGIHGTRKSDENTVGQDSSEGCVRMRDDDVKELYDFLVVGKSKVTIVE